MSYVYYNPNPKQKNTGDCVIRALAKFFNVDWITAYISICVYGGLNGDMPQVNDIWSSYLEERGYKKHRIPDTCPDCYTLKDFCLDHPSGKYFVSVDVGYIDLYESADSGRINGNHVVCVKDGDYYDAWDSGMEVPIYYWH